MKNKTKLQKFVALFSAMMLLVTSLGLQAFAEGEEATLQTLGVETVTGKEEAYYTAQATPGNNASLAGFELDGLYNFWGNAVVYVGAVNWTGLRIEVSGTSDLKYRFLPGDVGSTVVTPEQAGCALVGSDVRIKVGVTVLGDGTTEGTKKIQYKITIGAYQNTFDVDNVAAGSYIQRLFVYPQQGSLTVKAAESKYQVVGVETLADGANKPRGIVTYTGEAKPGNNNTITESSPVLFDGIYNFVGNACTYVGTAGWSGLRMQLDGANLKYWIAPAGSAYDKSVTPAEAGCEFAEKDVRIKVGISFVETNEDSTVDVEYAIWIGPKYHTTFVIENVDPTSAGFNLAHRLHVVPGTGSLTLKAVGPEHLTEITYADYGIADGPQRGTNPSARVFLPNMYTPEGGTAAKTTLDGTVLSVDVQFTGDGSTLYLAGTGDVWQGVRFQTAAGQFYFATSYGDFSQVSIPVASAGLDSQTEKFNLKISFEFVDHNGNGGKNDVKMGVWFNNKLFNNQYIYGLDNVSKYGTGVGFLGGSGQTINIASPKRQMPTDNTPYVLEDFGVEVKTHTGNYEGSKKGSITPIGSSISGKVALQEGDTVVLYGSNANAWLGARIQARSGNIEISHPATTTLSRVVACANPSDGFEFTVTENLLDLDGDGMKDDVRFGYWINGELANNRYYYFLDFASSVTKRVALQTVSGSVPVSETVADEYTSSPYTVYGHGDITVNGVAKANGTVLTPGDYNIRSARHGAYVENVVVYKVADAYVDNAVDVLDLVAIRNASKGSSNITSKAGNKAADVDGSGAIDATDCAGVRNILAGVQ